MRKVISTFAIQIFSVVSLLHAQPIILGSQFDNSVEISALAFQNDQILMLTEKCKQLYFLDNSGKVLAVQSIDNGAIKNRQVEIEGATWFRNGLMMTNEKIGEILYLDLKSGTVIKVEANYDLGLDIGGKGMEGIAVDSARLQCYVLKEKNDNSESVIRVFNIIVEKEVLRLQFVKNVRIFQPDNIWRFSDLTYNPLDDHLYLLKTKKGAYEITKINSEIIEQAGDQSLLHPIFHKDLSETINPFAKRQFNTNMEGISIKNGSFYLVSDNASTSVASCSELGLGKTLLLKIPF